MTAATVPSDELVGHWVRVTSPDGGSIHAGYLVEHSPVRIVVKTADGSLRALPPDFTVEQVDAPRNLVTPPDPLQEPRRRLGEPSLVPMGRRKQRGAPGRMITVSETDLRTVLAAASGIRAWMLAGVTDLPQVYDRLAEALHGTGR